MLSKQQILMITTIFILQSVFFYGKPDSNKFPQNGIDFLIQSSAFFLVEGSNQGVFTENYSLEITEITQNYWNNYIPLNKYDSTKINIGSNCVYF